jgi:glutathione S-transferase
MIKLHDFELSSACYKVRLLLRLLGIEPDIVPVDVYPGREHEMAEFARLSPLHEVPVIDDDGYVLSGAHPILTYLAAKYDLGRTYLPLDAALLGKVAQWLSFADRLAETAATARCHENFFWPADIEACRAGAHRLLRLLDEHLWFAEAAGQDWLCPAAHPTLADIACFPDVILCEEGGISRQDYPAIRRWTDRVKRIPGFAPMSGVFLAGPGAYLDILSKLQYRSET